MDEDQIAAIILAEFGDVNDAPAKAREAAMQIMAIAREWEYESYRSAVLDAEERE